MVEILSSPNSKGPSWDWLKIVKSSGARIKIRQFFRREMKEENGKMGRNMLDAEARRRGYSIADILTDDSFARLSSKMAFANQEEMFSSVGYGAVSANQVITKLIDYYRKSQPQVEVNKTFTPKSVATGGIQIKGQSGMLVHFAGCCNPVPGDEVIGFVSRGRGVTIHRKDCPNLKNADPERLIEATWTSQAGTAYNASIRILGSDQTEILTIVAGAVASLKLGIVGTNGRTDAKTKQVIVDFNIRINDKRELEVLIDKLRQHPKITDVFRTGSR